MSKKIFNFYYDLCCQKLVVYTGTSSQDVKTSLREILNIPDEVELEYLDEDGIPIVVSSALPDQIKIYVKKKKTFLERNIEDSKKFEKESSSNNNNNINSFEWFWFESSSNITHPRKNNNKTVYQPVNERTATCRGSLIMDSGEYYYSLTFTPLQCCVFASVCNSNSNKDDDIDWLDFWRIWSDYPDPHENFPGPTIYAGFYINMEKKLLVIYDAKLKKEVKRTYFNSTWRKVSPVVNFKHVVAITISSNAFRGRPSFIRV